MLRAKGAGLSTHYVLSEGAFSGAVVYDDGFDLSLSESDHFEEQLRSAQAFLAEHAEQCRALSDLLLPQAPLLDFNFRRKDGRARSFVFGMNLRFTRRAQSTPSSSLKVSTLPAETSESSSRS